MICFEKRTKCKVLYATFSGRNSARLCDNKRTTLHDFVHRFSHFFYFSWISNVQLIKFNHKCTDTIILGLTYLCIKVGGRSTFSWKVIFCDICVQFHLWTVVLLWHDWHHRLQQIATREGGMVVVFRLFPKPVNLHVHVPQKRSVIGFKP